MSRWKAASIHLSISIFVGLLVLALLFLVWYPPPYFDATGGEHLVIVLLGVDLVLGPVLTLILFKSGKKGMAFDLCMIGVVQSAALLYGLHVITVSRPVFIVAAVDRFNVVAAKDLDVADLAKGSKPEFRSLSWTGPRIVGALLPAESEERSKLLDSAIAGKDLQLLPQFYVAYEKAIPELLKHAQPVAMLRNTNVDALAAAQSWLTDHGLSEAQVVWVPVVARSSSLTMLLDAKTGEVLAALPADPW